MAGEPVVTIVGNTTAPADLRFTSSGKPVVNFTVASTPRTLNQQTNRWEDGEAMFVRCSAWEGHAENIAESLSKGMRVIVTGRMTVRSYEYNGQQRTSIEMQVDEVGPSLRYAKAQVQKLERSNAPAFGSPQSQQPPQQTYGENQDTRDPQPYAPAYGAGNGPQDTYDPWANKPSQSTFGDLPPF